MLACVGGFALAVPAAALASVPEVLTGGAHSIAPTEVTVEGFVSPGGERTTYYVAYGSLSSEWCASEGRSGKPEHTSATRELSGSAEFEETSVALTGLSSGTKYCAELIASNNAGSQRGGLVRFTAGAPDVVTFAARPTGARVAAVEGSIDPAGQSAEYFLEYGLANSEWCRNKTLSGSAERTTTPEKLAASSASVPVSVRLSELSPGQEYCARLVAKNSVATESGRQIFFTAGTPLALTEFSVLATTTTASLEGLIDPAGQATEYYFQYALASSEWCGSLGRSGLPEHASAPQALNYQGEFFAGVSVGLSGLTPGTEYCAEIVATNASGTSHGGQVPFSTRPVYALNVALAGNGAGKVAASGISCPGTCTASYPGGTKVTLTATAAPGSTFAGWSGACSGTGACTVTMSAARQVVATFAVAPVKALPEFKPTSKFTLKGNPRVNPTTGTVTFTVSVSYPGAFSWLLSFKNGSFGIISAHPKGCRRGQVKLKGRCRSAQVIFGKGSKTVAAGRVSFTVTPSAAARSALRAALRKGKGLLVSAILTFKAAGSASPVSRTLSVTVALKASGRGKHKG